DTQGHSSFLCLQTSKSTFSNYKSGLIVRDVLSLLYPKIKKFTQKVFMLSIHDYNQFVKCITSVQSQTASTDLNMQSNESTDNMNMQSNESTADINTPSVFDTPKSKPNYENLGIIN